MAKKNNPHYPIVATMISQLYDRLHSACDTIADYDTRNEVFSETIMYVLHDSDALKCSDAKAFIEHFKHRFKLITFRHYQDYKKRKAKEISYADYKQAQAKSPEEE